MKAIRYEVLLALDQFDLTRGWKTRTVEYWVDIPKGRSLFFNTALGANFSDEPRNEYRDTDVPFQEVDVDPELIYSIIEMIKTRSRIKDFIAKQGEKLSGMG